ncbi:MAG: hypothetical protein HYV16_09790 [Gammaproteobacteria bacterium]|nr:hypothetical protein [Gammaproteobacteria bacterium]
MAIAPLRLIPLPPPARPLAHPRAAVPAAAAIHQAGHEARGLARGLDEEIQAQKDNSLELRLIRAMLLKEKPELQPTEEPTPAEVELELELEQSQSHSIFVNSPGASLEIEMEQTQRISFSVSVDAEGEAHVELSIQQSQEISISLQAGAPADDKKDPLALDLDGDGLETTGLAQGRVFDLDGDGQAERVSVASDGDAFLALDRDGNGRIDDGRELFGDQNGAANGFEELRRFDDNGDGRLDGEDAIYGQLRLLRFGTRGQELSGLAEAGIASIDLAYREDASTLASGDLRTQQGSFRFTDGRRGEASDLLVHFEALA